MQPSIIELTTNLSAATLSINNVLDALGLNGDGPFSLQVITRFTELQSDNETLRAMQNNKLREALDAMLNDLNASIRREQTEREKNAKLLARIEELESCKIVRLTGSDITHIMQQEWNEYCDDTGCCPDDFRVDEGTGYLEFDAGTWANKVASRIIRKLPTLTETLRD